MLRRFVVVSLLVVASCWVPSGDLLSGQSDASSDDAIKKEVLKVEDERIQSHQQRDRAAMERIYADDLIWTFPTGERLTKAQFLDIILNEKLKPYVMSDGVQKPVTTIKQEDRKLYVFGTTVLVTRFAPTMELYNGKPLPHPRRFFNVYVKQDGKWQLVTHHSTPVAEKSP
jgi:ketosteroid isomerase-like protein